MGSAILLISCSGEGKAEDDGSREKLITQQSDTLTIISSDNGVKSYRFYAPLMERYEFAKEPYMEFRRGVNVVTYDSLQQVKSTLVADYAIYFENQKLWEAKGDVKTTNDQGHVLETQQLFWNQTTKKIYSNIDSRITQGQDVLVGIGFESDEDFKEWEFRRPRGKLAVDTEPNRDTTAKAPAAPQE